jgi:hypothetical protein
MNCGPRSILIYVRCRRISIQCKILRDRFFAIAFFWNVCSQLQLMRFVPLVFCISKESDRKKSIAQHCALYGNPPLSTLFEEFHYLAEKHFRIFCTFCIYCFIIFIWRWGIWTLNFLLRGAFEDIFCTGGGEFDQSNFKKFKFLGSARWGMLKFRIDRYIRANNNRSHSGFMRPVWTQGVTGRISVHAVLN